VTASGFRPYVQRGITLTVNQLIRLELKLEMGTDIQTVKVEANPSPLNFDNGGRQEGVSPDIINELPLVVAGGPRTRLDVVLRRELKAPSACGMGQ
jgi:hypothetical protein